mmetsp:Transcript_30008/g.90845  ORF Transcript_30008/g.90845 Transcript_30008/m.90845 type:complete len:293 (-) Transcript_30008:43-921(-)
MASTKATVASGSQPRKSRWTDSKLEFAWRASPSAIPVSLTSSPNSKRNDCNTTFVFNASAMASPLWLLNRPPWNSNDCIVGFRLRASARATPVASSGPRAKKLAPRTWKSFSVDPFWRASAIAKAQSDWTSRQNMSNDSSVQLFFKAVPSNAPWVNTHVSENKFSETLKDRTLELRPSPAVMATAKWAGQVHTFNAETLKDVANAAANSAHSSNSTRFFAATSTCSPATSDSDKIPHMSTVNSSQNPSAPESALSNSGKVSTSCASMSPANNEQRGHNGPPEPMRLGKKRRP